MMQKPLVRAVGRATAFGVGTAAGAYAAYVAAAWLGYGRVRRATGRGGHSLVDRFMPVSEVAECHHQYVAAGASMTFAAACELDIQRSAAIRAIFKGRELVLGSAREAPELPRGLLALTKALGWGVLAETPDREVVMGAVTRPWEADVKFRPIPPEEFAAFAEPGYVKIVWTLSATPLTDHESVACTETRVATTDAVTREKFRRYWAVFSPGILVIRRVALSMVKREAERRARERSRTPADRFDLASVGDLDAQC